MPFKRRLVQRIGGASSQHHSLLTFLHGRWTAALPLLQDAVHSEPFGTAWLLSQPCPPSTPFIYPSSCMFFGTHLHACTQCSSLRHPVCQPARSQVVLEACPTP